jgi:hypothetical protein
MSMEDAELVHATAANYFPDVHKSVAEMLLAAVAYASERIIAEADRRTNVVLTSGLFQSGDLLQHLRKLVCIQVLPGPDCPIRITGVTPGLLHRLQYERRVEAHLQSLSSVLASGVVNAGGIGSREVIMEMIEQGAERAAECTCSRLTTILRECQCSGDAQAPVGNSTAPPVAAVEGTAPVAATGAIGRSGNEATSQELHEHVVVMVPPYAWGQLDCQLPPEFGRVPIVNLEQGWLMYCCGGQCICNGGAVVKKYGPLRCVHGSDLSQNDASNSAGKRLTEFKHVYMTMEKKLEREHKWKDELSWPEAQALFSAGIEALGLHEKTQSGLQLKLRSYTWTTACKDLYAAKAKQRKRQTECSAAGPGEAEEEGACEPPGKRARRNV